MSCDQTSYYYYENGRNTWAVRDRDNKLVGRFAEKADAERALIDPSRCADG